MSSADLLRFVAEADQRTGALHSFMLVRHGTVVAEGWWPPHSATEPHKLWSLSKSFTSTAVGLAIDDGLLSVGARVLDFLSEDAPLHPCDNLRAMRIHDLLTMSTGQRKEDIGDLKWDSDGNLTRTILAAPVPHKPGSRFAYNSAATYLLSAIVQKLTGKTVRDYLQPRLFTPLGMGKPHWDACPRGISLGGIGLNLRTEDIAKFGLLCLRRGLWHGNPLVPASWIDTATSLQIGTGNNPRSDWAQGYGYQFWRCRHDIYRGDGAFGQYFIVIPGHDAVVAITGGVKDMIGMQAILNLVWKWILPAFADKPLPPGSRADSNALSLPVGGMAGTGSK